MVGRLFGARFAEDDGGFLCCTGYYRVAYDPTNYGLIREQLLLDHTVVAVNNRAQLLDDSLNIASVNLIPYAEALDLTLYLTVERDFVPFDSALTALGYIDGMLSATAGYADWQVHSPLKSHTNLMLNEIEVVRLYLRMVELLQFVGVLLLSHQNIQVKK